MADSFPTPTTADFDSQLKLALKHLRQPEWLGRASPLAGLYFLGRAAHGIPSTDAEQRGRILRQSLEDAGRRLWGENGPRSRAELEAALPEVRRQPGARRYSYLVLELRYFQQFFRPRRLPEIWEAFLGESRAEFYRDLDIAVQHLGEALLDLLRPAYRAEEAGPPGVLVGRTQALATCRQYLQAGQTVTVAGAGGMGKSSLGRALATDWAEGGVFWLTFRPMLNDDLGSVLFALGYFLHQRGASSLWRKLMADGGRLENPTLALGLLRYDLADLPHPPLLCFDEVDRLRPVDAETSSPTHRQLLEFLDSLRGQAPLLFIGQRAVLESDYHLALTGLTPADVSIWLRQVGVTASAAEIQQLHTYTHGNPRLVQLCLILREPDGNLGQASATLSGAAALQALFDRLWARTDPEEHRWLQWLSVMRGAAPVEGAPLARSALDSLTARGLALEVAGGGVVLWPAVQEMVEAELSAEMREQAHLLAARLRSAHAEYTAAAYHYWRAGYAREAIQVWFPHRRQEIARGQAGAALAVFQNISLNQVGQTEREALALLRAELKQLTGDLAGGSADLDSVAWTTPSELSAQARLLQGHFQNARGFPDVALESYAAGMAVVARLQTQLVRFHAKRSRVHIRQRRLDEAWREARLAQSEVENLQAIIQAEQGQYAAAQAAHERALAIAAEWQYDAGIAQTHRDLAALHAQQGHLEAMLAHTATAMGYYERIGDRYIVEMARINLAAGYVQARQFAQAAAAGREALRFFEQARDPYGQAGAAANLAEAYFELGDLAQAEHFAAYVIQQEEPHMLPYAFFTLGRVRQAQGRGEQAVQAFRTTAQAAEANGDRYLLAYAWRAWGEAAGQQGDSAESQALFRSALALFEELGLADEAAHTRQAGNLP